MASAVWRVGADMKAAVPGQEAGMFVCLCVRVCVRVCVCSMCSIVCLLHAVLYDVLWWLGVQLTWDVGPTDVG